jgi:hypothetical protein
MVYEALLMSSLPARFEFNFRVCSASKHVAEANKVVIAHNSLVTAVPHRR